MFHRFDQVSNRLVPSSQIGYVKARNFNENPTTQVVSIRLDPSMHHSPRGMASAAVVGGHAPVSEPGVPPLGLTGFPKYPKGTKLGKYIMGDYGPYDPKRRAIFEWMEKNPHIPPWKVTGRDRFVFRFASTMVVVTTLFSLFGLACVVDDRVCKYFPGFPKKKE